MRTALAVRQLCREIEVKFWRLKLLPEGVSA